MAFKTQLQHGSTLVLTVPGPTGEPVTIRISGQDRHTHEALVVDAPREVRIAIEPARKGR